MGVVRRVMIFGCLLHANFQFHLAPGFYSFSLTRCLGTGPLKTTKSYKSHKSCQTSFALPRGQLESAMGGEVE